MSAEQYQKIDQSESLARLFDSPMKHIEHWRFAPATVSFNAIVAGCREGILATTFSFWIVMHRCTFAKEDCLERSWPLPKVALIKDGYVRNEE